MEIRKTTTILEEVKMEMGKKLSKPVRRAAAIAVIRNPFAGKYEEDLQELIDIGREVGTLLASKAKDALGIKPEEVESYGKAAIVGTDGEIEHTAALLHSGLGQSLREALGGGKAIIPSAHKIGPAGTEIDIPLNYRDAASVRSHYDTMPVSVQDAPRPDEIVVALVITNSGRPLPRIGGLRKEEVTKNA